MSSFNPGLKKLRTIGIFMILMMLCIGSVAAARVVSHPAKISVAAPNALITSPEELVQNLVGNGVTVGTVTFTGSDNCANLFSGGSGIIGIDSGVVLGSGDTYWTGPNTADDYGVDNSNPGDSDLATLVPGYPTYDACVLEFDFVPTTNVITFDYVFSSDEYNEWANSQYNDVFGFFVNGQNVALIPGTSTPVAINNINMGNPGTGLVNTVGNDPTPHNAIYYRNNDLQDGGPFINTEMDGLTTVFTATANVNHGVTNHIKLAIADAGDGNYDSNVFIKAGSFSAEPLTLEPLTATNPVGSTHTVTATYTPPAGVAASGKAVNFEITAGPNAGMTGGDVTDANGVATWSYTSTLAGTDTIHAFILFTDAPNNDVSSNLAFKAWVTDGNNIPEFPSMFLPVTMIIGFLGAVVLIQRIREN
jgi:hypothetical protein